MTTLQKEPTEKKPHSAEYFGDYRDYWWNSDFLKLMGQRLRLDEIETALDVGCGIGHWGLCLRPFFSKTTQVIGIDRETAWVAKASEKAAEQGLTDRYRYLQGDVLALPFKDNQFDLVTCQTVLIHLKDPKAGLREMLRVVKPGGLILVAEPNNFANCAVASNLTAKLSIVELLDRLRFQLLIQRGKQALGLGFNSEGDLIPGYLRELGGEGIQVYTSDKAVPFFPPYSSDEQQANVRQMKEWAERNFIGWDRDEVFGYFVAGGGNLNEFDRYFDQSIQDSQETIQAIDNGTYHCAGGAVSYLISCRKGLK